MANLDTFVIVGASLAGAKAAETLREEGFDGQVILIGEETSRPYDRPPLSKGYLQGTEDRDKIYVHDEGWYAKHEVDLRLGTAVTAIDREAHDVELADGSRQHYDKLLLATGSVVRRIPEHRPRRSVLPAPGLRRRPPAGRLLARGSGRRRAAAVGSGWRVPPRLATTAARSRCWNRSRPR